MDDARRKLVRRVINLSQVAAENATPGEVENAERIGKALVRKHGITLAECDEVYTADLEAERVRLGRRPAPPPPRDFGTPPPLAGRFDPYAGPTTGNVYANGPTFTIHFEFD